jgi:sugar porter (SP) family MFS transporter
VRDLLALQPTIRSSTEPELEGQLSNSNTAFERLNGRLVLWSLTSALAGFLFGFDTVVISGAEQKIQALWSLSPGLHGMAIASTLYGTVIGSLAGGWPTDRFGRKPTLIFVGILYIVSAIWSALAPDVTWLILARLLGGIGIGVSTVVAPLYISEIAPPRHRGLLAGSFQFNIVFGIVVAYLSNALFSGGADDWRWMLGIAAIPSVLYTILCFFIPESPRWLLTKKGDRIAGLAVLRMIQPQITARQVQTEADEIIASSARAAVSKGIWRSSLTKPILLAICVAVFNQLSGVNAILYFAPRIFEMTGLGTQAALLQSIGVGMTNLVFTFVGLWLIDRLGRRRLLMIGSYGYIISLGLIAWAFFSKNYTIVPVCIFSFIAAHAIGQGTVIWVLISEVFPTEHRAGGQALGSFTHWMFAALVTSFFPLAVSAFQPEYIFLFFCGMMVLQLLWVKITVTETKGVPLERMQERLARKVRR